MGQNTVNLYYQENFNLAKTLNILSIDSANGINNLLTQQYGSDAVDINHPETWKYYLNITGNYHVTDTLMKVTSLDTLRPIDFTISNLQTNTATLAAYQYGTRYYYSLLNQYPNQEQLILGILYPANIEKALNSKQGTILSYPTNLVQPQELTLIYELQNWIYLYLDRWNVKAFTLTDSLYQTSYHAIMYLNLILKLLNLRLKRCHTNEAHTFHITEYLASNYGLDKYMEDMTLEQILFFYRNIKYIERNVGFTSTFKLLINELLTKRNIPIASITAKLTSVFDGAYKSTLSFDTTPINSLSNAETKTRFTYSEFMSMLVPLATDNGLVFNSNLSEIEGVLKNSPSSVLGTKELISSMYDYSDAVPFKFTDILLNEWIYLSANNLYTAYVEFTDPITAIPYTVTAEDAFIYMTYLFLKSIGLNPTIIPEVPVNKICKLTPPTASAMVSLCDPSFTNAIDYANFFLSLQPTDFQTTSITAFYSLCTSIFESGLQQWYKAAGEGEITRRANIENMADYLYGDTIVSFNSSGQQYATWLKAKSLPDLNYTMAEFQQVISVIYNAATGLSLVNKQPFAQIQTAMLNILQEISSYSIQVIQEINTTSIVVLNWAAIRAGNIESTIAEEEYVQENVGIVDYSFSVNSEINMETNHPISNLAVQDVTVHAYNINVQADYVIENICEESYYINTWQYMVRSSDLVDSGFSNYSTLTTAQANSLVSIY